MPARRVSEGPAAPDQAPPSAAARPLKRYTEKRNFGATPEPPETAAIEAADNRPLGFVVQKHWASRLHYDFRLELDGVLVSWAVPKGPSFDPAEMRIAVHVEDHPVSYAGFEGTIPKGQYGAGTVIVWDRGEWEPVGDPRAGLAAGKLVFRLHGDKLAGLWELVKIARPGERQEPWILFKKRDAWARPLAEYDVIRALPDSVVSKPLGRLEARQPVASGDADGAPAPSAAAARPALDGAALAPSSLDRASRAALPASLAPQLATAAAAPPSRGEWVFELKFDGYRLLARTDARGQVRLFTRNGHDWTDRLKPVAAAVAAFGLASSWLDGEIVVLRDDGTPDFNALQNAIDSARHREAIRYFIFDLPFCEGYDLRRAPLVQRRALLQRRLGAHLAALGATDDGKRAGHGADTTLRFSADFAADAASLLESARALGLEGIIAKRAEAPYVSERNDTWLKLKNAGRQEFVIGGFTLRQGSATEIGSLLLGVYDDAGHLVHAGSVGTGWDSKGATALLASLAPLEAKATPFAAGSPDPGRWSRRAAGAERWVKPERVAEIRFAGWTPAGHVRHAVFMGLRSDKPAREVQREGAPIAVPGAGAGSSRENGDGKPNGRRGTGSIAIRITNPERVIDASSGLTKLDLVRYYDSIAGRMLPHLKGRPVSLVRGPEGVSGQLFFQKHDEAGSIPAVRQLDRRLWPEHAPLLEIASAEALVAAAQMNVIEFHTWNSTVKRIDQPDRIVFDLDPGEGVSWARMQEAAVLTRTLLDELGLKSWLKTSGGKGLHVVVPITPSPKLGYDTVKDLSQAMVQHLARTIPSRFVARSGAANRVGKIFVDYLRNGHGATTAAAFSARARPGLGVSMPVSWDDLSSLKSGAEWTIATARERLSFETADPWADYFKTRQSLRKAMTVLRPSSRFAAGSAA